MSRIATWIREVLIKENRNNQIPYINSDIKFCSLKHHRPDVYNQIFTTAFLNSLKKDNPILFKEWIKCCVGFADPVFLVSLSYHGKQNARLTKIIYNVLKIDQVMGGGGILDTPITTYVHELEYKEGKQERDIEPNILINTDTGGSHFSFRLMLTPKFNRDISDKIGRVWVFTMEFVTSHGHSVTSDPIAITMNRFN